MRIVPLFALVLLAIGACSSRPFGLADDEWNALTPEEKVAVSQQWFAIHEHPPAAILTPAGVTPADAVAKARLERETARLQMRLDQAEARVRILEQRVREATAILNGQSAPAKP